jgi:hypothetical protein
VKFIAKVALLVIVYLVLRAAFHRSDYEAPTPAPTPVATAQSSKPSAAVTHPEIGEDAWVTAYVFINKGDDGLTDDQLTILARDEYRMARSNDDLSAMGMRDDRTERTIQFINQTIDNLNKPAPRPEIIRNGVVIQSAVPPAQPPVTEQ